MSEKHEDVWKQLNETIESSTLYIVSTPIGNLADITIRALHVLSNVDYIAAEDTRHTRVLLNRYGIEAQLRSYHEHNAAKVFPQLLEELRRGSAIALVSDAGTPGVSDPGYRLIHEAIDEGFKVIPISGASALLAAIVPSGLPLDRFVFEGFLPKKKGRSTKLNQLVEETRTMVFYESPKRLSKTLKEFCEIFGLERQCVVCRELTKNYEEFVRGTLEELNEKYKEENAKGEIVIVLEGKRSQKKRDKSLKNRKRNNYMPFPESEDLDDDSGKLNFPSYSIGDSKKKR